jgi:hypothetical protein
MVEPLSRSLALAPLEEEEITSETAAALDRARASLAHGAGSGSLVFSVTVDWTARVLHSLTARAFRTKRSSASSGRGERFRIHGLLEGESHRWSGHAIHR